MDSSKLGDLLGNLSKNIIILPSAEKDLTKILKRNFKEFEQIFSDINRLGDGTLPPAGRKKLRTFNAWQFDAGRFRVAYAPKAQKFYILAVFPKSDQNKKFRSLN